MATGIFGEIILVGAQMHRQPAFSPIQPPKIGPRQGLWSVLEVERATSEDEGACPMNIVNENTAIGMPRSDICQTSLKEPPTGARSSYQR